MATLWRREGLHSRPLRKDFHNQRSECLYIQVVHEAGFYLLICFEIEERLCVCGGGGHIKTLWFYSDKNGTIVHKLVDQLMQ